jgi:hypothetical protein
MSKKPSSHGTVHADVYTPGIQASKSEPRVNPTSEPEWDPRNITSFAEKYVQDDGIDQGYVVRGRTKRRYISEAFRRTFLQ